MQCLWSGMHVSTLGYTVRILPGFPPGLLCHDTPNSSFDTLALGTGESWRYNKGLSSVFFVRWFRLQLYHSAAVGLWRNCETFDPLSSRVWGSSTYQAAGED